MSNNREVTTYRKPHILLQEKLHYKVVFCCIIDCNSSNKDLLFSELMHEGMQNVARSKTKDQSLPLLTVKNHDYPGCPFGLKHFSRCSWASQLNTSTLLNSGIGGNGPGAWCDLSSNQDLAEAFQGQLNNPLEKPNENSWNLLTTLIKLHWNSFTLNKFSKTESCCKIWIAYSSGDTIRSESNWKLWLLLWRPDYVGCIF